MAETPDLLGPLVGADDSAGAHAALDRILGARSLDSALRDVVLPVLHEVGEGWARGSSPSRRSTSRPSS